MRIRHELLLLLLLIAVIPLALAVGYGQVTTRVLGEDLARRSRESLTSLAAGRLAETARRHAEVMGVQADALEHALRWQAREIERLLATELDGRGLPLGIDADWDYKDYTRDGFTKGEIILIGTDGIWETRNEAGDFFGREAVRELIRRHADRSAEKIQTAILEAVDAFRGDLPMQDDVTLIVVKVAV